MPDCLAAATLAVLSLGAWWAMRIRGQVRLRRRPLAVAVPGVVVAASCLVAVIALPSIAGHLAGRDVTLWQVMHVCPAVVTLLLALTVAAGAVTVAAVAGPRRARGRPCEPNGRTGDDRTVSAADQAAVRRWVGAGGAAECAVWTTPQVARANVLGKSARDGVGSGQSRS